MGVPKFFRYISERYPCLSELAREQCIPEFDNLYLDMNGIIHTCSHPDDSNFHFTITEENIFKEIFNYIDKLFFLIKPQKLFFMAVDGVAPRAKMNQQRSRRFRSAKDAEILEAKAKSRGEVREHERFDSNCITPGTEFMTRLHEALRYFVKSKISSDPLWQKCRVILSGQDAPGEGEHKIMDYIRYLKSKKDYDPNTRHCLYGLDADLIILGLCTHELHFVVLREEVKFGRKAKQAAVEETRFFLLHLGLMREYLEMEFDKLKQIDDKFDISNLIDDWVLMGFLVGNDFIPHLPCMHISSNALPLLYDTYIKVYPSLGGNINEKGHLNLERLEKYFAELADVEFKIFQENHADLKYFEAKQTKNGIDEAFDFDISEITNDNQDADLAILIESSRQFLEDDDEDLPDEEQHISDEFETYKRNYYLNKLNQDDMNNESKREQAICYITALQWILDYYYRGVLSWDWYYPHHYAPFISDLKNFKDYKFNFNLGKPFLPFEQLLAVLPAASRDLLPSAYRDLMTSATSELLEYYPQEFETDLNGKRHEWEAVVLIPFIDEKLLLNAMKDCEKNLTPSEIRRNQHGPMLQYDYTRESQGSVPGIFSMKALYHVYCTEQKIWSKEIAIPSDKTVCVELLSPDLTLFVPGFPTMKHLKYDFDVKFARVRVFDQPSRNESVILKPQNRERFDDVYSVAEKCLNQSIYIGWPHLIKAKVVGISSKEKYIDTSGMKDMDPKLFQIHMKTAQEHLATRMGIEFDDFTVLVHVRTHVGSTYTCGNQGKIIINDAWGQAVTAYPAQGVVSEIAVQKNLALQPKKVENLFPTDSTVFFLGSPYFGSEGTVLNPLLVYECGRLKVNITVLPEPDFSVARIIQQNSERDYINSFQASVRIGLHMKCLGRVTGTVLVIAGARRTQLPENVAKTNIGLQLKFPKQQEERTEYCRRISNQWYYTSKAIALIQAYFEKFPMVFEYLSRSSDRNEFCFEEDLFPGEVGEHKMDEIVTWLKSQEHVQADRRSCGSQSMGKEAVQSVLDAIEQLKTLPVKTVKLQVKPHLLLKPNVTLPNLYKPKRPVKLFDRVVVVKTTYMVPLGAKATVIGVYPVIDPNPVRLECVKAVDTFYELLFDKHLPGGNDIYGIAEERVYKVSESSLLLIFAQDNKPNEMQDAALNLFANDDRFTDDNSNNSLRARQQQQPSQTRDFNEPSCSNNSKVVMLQQKQTPAAAAASLPAQTINKHQVGESSSAVTIGHDDFWMPAAETKMKQTTGNELGRANVKNNIIEKNSGNIEDQAINSTPLLLGRKQDKAMQQPSNSNKLLRNTAPSSVGEMSECQAETQVLKSLLGVGLNSTAAQLLTPNNNTSGQPSKTHLPQPPAGWRSDAQQAQQLPQNSRQHYPTSNLPLQPPLPLHQQQVHPSPLLHFGGGGGGATMANCQPLIMSKYSDFFPLMPQPRSIQHATPNSHQQTEPHAQPSPSQLPQHQQPQTPTNKGNVAPTSTVKENVEYLQRNLKNLQIKSEASNMAATPQQQQQQTTATPVSNSQITPEASNMAAAPQQQQQTTATPATVAVDNSPDIKKQPKRKRSARVPKIGARFDNAH
ncbi:5'-3' exoribonuclease 1 isoform X2 [Anastrepha obliqua]|uniref:5'-3' exoribonuclease 1 isoform X2 n=1 Tax=Anastrepha obliqua TaxID=95512 RepID=UPI0024092BFF|nr:5'-3' exoribonuclease 1 isoform X2 [Anastrepha obliqua]